MKNLLWLMLLVMPQVFAAPLPRPDHIVIVIEENKHYSQIIGNDDAPYINALTKQGTLFTHSYGVAHPSQPNYLALFTGSTHNISSDVCPLDLSGPNLVEALHARGLSFAIYSESLPETGAEDCVYGGYRRKHNPVADWKELAQYSLPFSAFPQDFAKLPTVAWVVPDQRNDMHDGSIAQGDAWLEKNIKGYAQWAVAHNSLLILTWDEDNWHDNRIATLFVGSMVKRGRSTQRIDHYGVLRTVEDMYGLSHLNRSAQAKPITGVWLPAR